MTTFRIQAGALRAAVAKAAPLCSSGRHRASVRILTHLRLQAAAAGVLQVRATNLEQHIEIHADGDGTLPAITASAARLRAILSGLPPEETVSLTVEDAGQLRLAAGSLVARLFTLPAEDFPDHRIPTGQALSITAAALLRLLDRPRHAISTEETRYPLNGIYLHRAGGKLRAAGTDGHRLFVAEEPYVPLSGAIPGGIVPRLAVQQAVALLRQLPGDTMMTWQQSESRAALIARSWRLDMKLIDGTFPDYSKVIPDGEGAVPIVVHNAAGLARATATAAAISEGRTQGIRLSNGQGKTLTLSTYAAEFGDCTVTVDSEIAAWGTDQTHPTIGVRARYLIDLCRAFPGGFTMRVPSDACGAIRCEGAEGLAALMPMRI